MSDLLPFLVVGLTAGSVYGLAAIGLVLTYRTSGIFNFAHGTVAALMAYAFHDLTQTLGLPWPVALFLCLFVLAPVIGIAFERIARRLVEAPVAMRIVATVGLVVALQQLAVIRYGSTALRAPVFLPTSPFEVFGVTVTLDQVIIMLISLGGAVLLAVLLRKTAVGRQMRGVVDNPQLVSLAGVDPVGVRRTSWFLGTAFAGLSGILLAPTLGVDALLLTLLVVQAFGAAAVGGFTSIPLTYVGGVAIGVVAEVSKKYVAQVPSLAGLAASLPFLVLFGVLLFASRSYLVDIAPEKRGRTQDRPPLPRPVRLAGAAVLLAVVLAVPTFSGTRLPVYTEGAAYTILFLSLALLIRTSGQISLAQLAFAAVGACTSARLTAEAGLPFVLAVLLGALATVPVGLLLAVPAIRRSGLYLALATFGFGVLTERLLFGTPLMFGSAGTVGSLPAPRPTFADGDTAYYYVVLAFVAFAVLVVTFVHRSRLGRLLRAMSDSPVALSTYGGSVTQIKIVVFCIAAFLAGMSGALLGPVTRATSAFSFTAFASLLLVVVLAIAPGDEVLASIGAAVSIVVIPAYLTNESLAPYLPMVFGVAAVGVAVGAAAPVGGGRGRDEPPERGRVRRPGPVQARAAAAGAQAPA